MSVLINKMGSLHVFEDIANQDYFLAVDNIKMVLDGCSKDENGEWLKSEVGVKLFSQLFERLPKDIRNNPELLETCVNLIFDKLISLATDKSFISQNFCFTILIVYELEEKFVVKYCGDGYIITRKKNVSEAEDELEYISLESECNEGCPKYYVYNYISSKLYSEGVSFKTKEFSKEEYENVGIASDGLRYLLDLGFPVKSKLDENLLNDKAGRIRVQIARNYDSIKDDITICY
ncbi:MAG: hypothetical protein Q4D02_07205 [Clostridia bacterium]|nr:hypothetical protein [Clostridia bacterium]